MFGFLRKLFDKAAPSNPAPAGSAKTAPALDPSKDPNMIRVFDAYGREMFMSKQDWKDKVLKGHLEKVWNTPEELDRIIVQSLEDGFAEDMIKPALQFANIAPTPERGALLLGVVYLQNKRFEEAGQVLEDYLEKHGPSPYIYTNLAKVYSARGEKSRAIELLWQGLQIDPNQENGCVWYLVQIKEDSGHEAAREAGHRLASLPGSWRAWLWLAREDLHAGKRDEALACYESALAATPREKPTGMLQQISGDLGNAGHLPEIINLVSPHFSVEQHGIAVGNNLLKAHLDLGQLDAVRRLLDVHYAQKRPDWRQTLSFWDTELAKAQAATVETHPAGKLEMALLTNDGPLWLPADSPAGELFAAQVTEGPRVAFLGGTATMQGTGDKISHQLSDNPGRLSRALPLFLADQFHFRTCARVKSLQCWLLGEHPAFVFSGKAWNDEDAAQHARSGEHPADYVIVTHIDTATTPWAIGLRVIRTIDACCLGEANTLISMPPQEPPLGQLADAALAILQRETDLSVHEKAAWAQWPKGASFATCLLRSEQLLAALCAAREKSTEQFLSGTRDIVQGNIELCIQEPTNVVVRLILLRTLACLGRSHPVLLPEFRDQVHRLQKEKPLPQPAQGVMLRIVAGIYPES